MFGFIVTSDILFSVLPPIIFCNLHKFGTCSWEHNVPYLNMQISVLIKMHCFFTNVFVWDCAYLEQMWSKVLALMKTFLFQTIKKKHHSFTLCYRVIRCTYKLFLKEIISGRSGGSSCGVRSSEKGLRTISYWEIRYRVLSSPVYSLLKIGSSEMKIFLDDDSLLVHGYQMFLQNFLAFQRVQDALPSEYCIVSGPKASQILYPTLPLHAFPYIRPLFSVKPTCSILLPKS